MRQVVTKVGETVNNLTNQLNLTTQEYKKLLKDYNELYNLFIVILDACDEKTLILHKSQLKRFSAEYRVDISSNKNGEITLSLKTLAD
jgi:hypothetical protein